MLKVLSLTLDNFKLKIKFFHTKPSIALIPVHRQSRKGLLMHGELTGSSVFQRFGEMVVQHVEGQRFATCGRVGQCSVRCSAEIDIHRVHYLISAHPRGSDRQFDDCCNLDSRLIFVFNRLYTRTGCISTLGGMPSLQVSNQPRMV